jgi:hypothetical protein
MSPMPPRFVVLFLAALTPGSPDEKRAKPAAPLEPAEVSAERKANEEAYQVAYLPLEGRAPARPSRPVKGPGKPGWRWALEVFPRS